MHFQNFAAGMLSLLAPLRLESERGIHLIPVPYFSLALPLLIVCEESWIRILAVHFSHVQLFPYFPGCSWHWTGFFCFKSENCKAMSSMFFCPLSHETQEQEQ